MSSSTSHGRPRDRPVTRSKSAVGSTSHGDNEQHTTQDATQATRKPGLGRGPNHIVGIPMDPNQRIPLKIRANGGTDFEDGRAVKCISQLCLNGWPTGAITWSGTPQEHKDNVWEEFKKRFSWESTIEDDVYRIFKWKCEQRTKDNLKSERDKALAIAEFDHPKEGEKFMHDYNPWWCEKDVWVAMVHQWGSEEWKKKTVVGAKNRAAGVEEGEKPRGTYKGGSITQGAHADNWRARSDEPLNFIDLYVATRNGLPEVDCIAAHYKRLIEAKYGEGPTPFIDQELWETASGVKKNYIKGIGPRPRPRMASSYCSSSQSNKSFDPIDLITRICKDRSRLAKLTLHLQELTAEELATAMSESARQQEQQQEQQQKEQHDEQQEHQQ